MEQDPASVVLEGFARYLPAGHAVHDAAFVPEYLPAAHCGSNIALAVMGESSMNTQGAHDKM